MNSHHSTIEEAGIRRLRATIRGAVQGVGFRPFIYRVAIDLALAGWVQNTAHGVSLEVEGPPEALEAFLSRVTREHPPRAAIHGLESVILDPVGFTTFEILRSEAGEESSALLLPDIATCADCLREMRDPADRRYRYPFINCTNCGPRYSIIEALPYDRARTSMKDFVMCERCRAECEDPRDRRFHAQPNACPECGPQLALWRDSETTAVGDAALREAAAALARGEVAAVKGLGGFHLMADARDDAAVRRLRERKHREEKPLAVLFPSLEAVEAACEVSDAEARLLLSPECPIVLLRRAPGCGLAPSVAPDNPYIGAMLPYTPLHHLLAAEMGFPVVATSGNLTDEPICIDEHEARARLRGIADLFLVHNRPIVRHVDDSLARVMLGRAQVLRRARGYAPLPVTTARALPSLLAVGAHLKNAVALSVRDQVFISQHIGDLESTPAFETFERVIADLRGIYALQPEAVACDLHPDYLSTRHARRSDLPVIPVQHHQAHVFSCMAENEIVPPLLGVAWDGAGFGEDGVVWGGEFFQVEAASCRRAAHFRAFPLPGGDQAAREPRRTALGLLYARFGDALFAREALPLWRAFSDTEKRLLRAALARGIHAPLTTSVGRLFDAVSALVSLRAGAVGYEGQAAMALEFALDGVAEEAYYHYDLVAREDGVALVDWGPMVDQVLDDVAREVPAGIVSARFHNALAEIIVAVARHVGPERVALSGGCFQNRYLTERAVRRLREEGFRPYWHQRVPPNDGGIALGQVLAASRAQRHSDQGDNSCV